MHKVNNKHLRRIKVQAKTVHKSILGMTTSTIFILQNKNVELTIVGTDELSFNKS